MARNLFGPTVYGRRSQPPVRRSPFLPPQRVSPQPQPQRTTGGGLSGVLQKILNRGSRGAQTTARAALPASGSSSGGVSFLDMLNHTQSALKAAESFMPMVQEYGPMVKNLPSMLKMMKALKDINLDDDEAASETAEKDKDEEKDKGKEDEKTLTSTEKEEKAPSEQKPKKSRSGESLPKMYI